MEDFQTREGVVRLDACLLRHCDLLAATAQAPLGERADVLFPLLTACANTGRALSTLARAGFLNEVIMLSRAFVERMVTAGYLAVCDREEVDQYIAYTRQKAYRKLSREVATSAGTASLKYNGEIDVAGVPGLQEALDRFTGKRGGEVRRWTRLDVPEMAEVVAKRSGTTPSMMLLSYLATYEDASEALHGTLYGVTFHLGVQHPGVPLDHPEGLERYTFTQMCMVFMLGTFLSHDIIAVIHSQTPIPDLFTASSRNQRFPTPTHKMGYARPGASADRRGHIRPALLGDRATGRGASGYRLDAAPGMRCPS
jgi:hypothetical protein